MYNSQFSHNEIYILTACMLKYRETFSCFERECSSRQLTQIVFYSFLWPSTGTVCIKKLCARRRRFGGVCAKVSADVAYTYIYIYIYIHITLSLPQSRTHTLSRRLRMSPRSARFYHVHIHVHKSMYLRVNNF